MIWNDFKGKKSILPGLQLADVDIFDQNINSVDIIKVSIILKVSVSYQNKGPYMG